MMPTLPLPPPDNALAMMAIGRLLDRPQNMLVNMVTVRPTKITGLRPRRSDARPQAIAVQHCASEKTALVIPAQYATSSLRTLKDSIISGYTSVNIWGHNDVYHGEYETRCRCGVERHTKYGYTEVEAIGSANLQIARISLSNDSHIL